MNPNSEVYGAPSTWQYSFINGGLTTEAAKALKIQKAKVPTWDWDDNPGYWTSQLREGIVAQKITQNVPIDKTVCAVGMGRDCPFATMGYFRRRADTETPSDVMLNSIASVGSGGVINGFLWEMRDESSYGVYNLLSAGGGQIDEKQMEFRCWAPESNSIRNTNKQNGNYFIAPYTYYQLKTFIASVEVNVCNSADVPDDPTISGVVPQATWRPIDTWKNSYSTHKITGFRLNFARANSILDSGGRITYSRPAPPSSYTYSVPCGFGLLDEIQFDDEYDYKRYMYALFNDSASGGSWNTVIFKPFTDTVWTSSVHRVAFMGMYDIFNGDLKYLPSAVWYQIDYSDDVYEKLCRAAATFGFIFVTDGTLTLPSAMNTDNICFPVITEGGIAHGDYTRGEDNLSNDIYNADSVRDKNYDPSVPVDPNNYSNTTGFNSLSGGASATIKYVLDSSNVRQLLTDLWTISHNIAGADYENYDYKILDSFLVSSPIDSIVSIKRFPFEIPHTFSTQKTNVCLGKNTGSAQGYVTHNVFNSVVFSGVQIFPKFGNSFLDYAPYTEYELYIPFCGTVKLNAGDILGHTLNCRLQIDLTTGACVAYIMADNLVIETASGVVSCELQVAGTDSATVDSAIQNAVINHIGARTNKEIAMLSPLTFGGLLSAVSNPVKTSGAMENANNEISRADYNLTHIQTPVHSMGSAGGLTGWIQEFNARLIIYYPEGEAIDSSAPVSSTSPHLADLTAYAHNVGFACVLNGTVSEFHGKTVGNIDTSSIVGATEEERAQIKALFAQGVWLP